MLLDAFSISLVVKGVLISAGFMIVGSSAVIAVHMFLNVRLLRWLVPKSSPEI